MRVLFAVLIGLGVLPGTVRGQASQRPASGPPVVRRAIERSNELHLAALRKGDAKLFASRFTPDATLLQVSGKVIRGRKDITQWFSNQIDGLGTLRDGEIVTRDVFVIGAIVYETGHHRLTFERGGEPSATLEGRYVAAWRRGRDGSWKVLRLVEVPRD